MANDQRLAKLTLPSKNSQAITSMRFKDLNLFNYFQNEVYKNIVI